MEVGYKSAYKKRLLKIVAIAHKSIFITTTSHRDKELTTIRQVSWLKFHPTTSPSRWKHQWL